MTHGLIVFSAAYLYLVIVALAGLAFALANRQDKINLAYLALVALPLAYLIAKLSGLVISSPRPFLLDHIPPMVPATPDNGFPSDHTLLSMTVALLIFAVNRKFGALLIALAAAVGAGRVLAHAHHPIDVIGSTVIALIAVLIAGVVAPRLQALWSRRTTPASQ